MMSPADNLVLHNPVLGVADTCKVVVLCEDALARAQAMHVCEHLLGQFGEDLDFEFGWWKLSRLAETPLAHRIMQAAAAADIILFCVRGGELPTEAADWLESWAESGVRGDGALAFVSAEGPNRCSAMALSRLERAAKRLELDFIRFTPAAVEAAASVLPHATASDRHASDIRDWGLNE